MDEAVVQRIMDTWRLVTGWARPDAERVAKYRSALRGAGSVLVMGATPELIDMLLAERVERATAVDAHPETIEAMRRLAGEDWSGVELVVGDWRDAQPSWESAFDLVLCDGGLMFLPFPDDWRRVLALIQGYLRPGGRFIATFSSVSPREPGFKDHYAAAIARFEAERAHLEPDQQTRKFVELTYQLRGTVRFGAVDPEGRVRLDVAGAARRWIVEDLRRRYPEFDEAIEAHLGRPSVVGRDGLNIVAVPDLERVTAEMAGCGFDVEVLASTRRPPKHSFQIAAIRRDESQDS